MAEPDSLLGQSDSRAKFPCRACGELTEVSVHVRMEVPEQGMTVPCWACGEPLLIPAHPSTVEAARRERELLGVATIAAGDIERGKAILDTAKRPEDEHACRPLRKRVGLSQTPPLVTHRTMKTKPITANQRNARTTVAKRLTCPKCERQNALSSRYELVAESGVLAGVRVEGSARSCRYCGHVVGIRNHVPFGHHPHEEGP